MELILTVRQHAAAVQQALVCCPADSLLSLAALLVHAATLAPSAYASAAALNRLTSPHCNTGLSRPQAKGASPQAGGRQASPCGRGGAQGTGAAQGGAPAAAAGGLPGATQGCSHQQPAQRGQRAQRRHRLGQHQGVVWCGVLPSFCRTPGCCTILGCLSAAQAAAAGVLVAFRGESCEAQLLAGGGAHRSRSHI